MQDEDFLPELRQNNELLIKYLTQDRLLELVDLISIEPPFDANACRCFKLPFVAQQALCIESEFIMSQVIEDPEFKILNRLMQFISVPEEVQLNSTLCGYFNKIISYWLIKKPAPMVKFFDLNQHYLNDIVEHVYLNSSIIDIIIRIFCVQDLSEEEVLTLNSIRCEIIHNTINKLEHYQDDYFMTEQLFCIWTGLLKKCYVMLNPKSLFDEILSPFTLKPILDYTFQPQFGKHTCMGAEFLSLLIFNLFISEPHDAIQDVLEVNFGFQVTSVAGMQVEQSQNEKEKEEENEQDIMNNILTTYNEMYTSYGEGDNDFFKYFENDFVRVTSSGDIQRGVEKPKVEWTDYLKIYSVYLKSFSKPEIILSPKQAITIGDYEEYFINRETKDSIYNRGVYIASWNMQEDGSWKISMDTWHAGLDKE